jgi:hypothetical protein
VKLNGKPKETFGATITEFLLRRQKEQCRSWDNINQGMGQRVKITFVYNDRIILTKFKTYENGLVVLQMHMPTSGYEDEE